MENLNTTFLLDLPLQKENGTTNINGFFSKSENWAWICLMGFPEYEYTKSWCLKKEV